jgi:hypothetical protein
MRRSHREGFQVAAEALYAGFIFRIVDGDKKLYYVRLPTSYLIR